MILGEFTKRSWPVIRRFLVEDLLYYEGATAP